MFLHCVACKTRYPQDPMLYSCSRSGCGTPLEVLYEEEYARVGSLEGRGVWRYEPILPVKKSVTLGEGSTGLHLCERLGPRSLIYDDSRD